MEERMQQGQGYKNENLEHCDGKQGQWCGPTRLAGSTSKKVEKSLRQRDGSTVVTAGQSHADKLRITSESLNSEINDNDRTKRGWLMGNDN